MATDKKYTKPQVKKKIDELINSIKEIKDPKSILTSKQEFKLKEGKDEAREIKLLDVALPITEDKYLIVRTINSNLDLQSFLQIVLKNLYQFSKDMMNTFFNGKMISYVTTEKNSPNRPIQLQILTMDEYNQIIEKVNNGEEVKEDLSFGIF
ncbi:MAG: hypothetical protein ACJA0H_001846 [Francisellaceae bacterium]|jgi:hypothetical protein